MRLNADIAARNSYTSGLAWLQGVCVLCVTPFHQPTHYITPSPDLKTPTKPFKKWRKQKQTPAPHYLILHVPRLAWLLCLFTEAVFSQAVVPPDSLCVSFSPPREKKKKKKKKRESERERKNRKPNAAIFSPLPFSPLSFTPGSRAITGQHVQPIRTEHLWTLTNQMREREGLPYSETGV